MNAKNGKCGVFAALTAALLVTAALITSCAPEEVIVYKDGYQPPEGMGYIVINAPGFTGERTILPSPGTWTEFDLSIQQYTTQTTGTGTTTGGAISRTVSATALGNPINLAPGFYEVTVTASVGAGQEAAQGTSTRFTISAGTGTPVNVTIKPFSYTEGTDPGTFEYTVIFTGLTSATAEMTIAPISGGAAYGAAFSVTEGVTTPISTLTPGSYSVFVEATVPGGATASITEIVNIHQNLKSSVTFEFNGTYFVAYINGINPIFNAEDIKPTLTKNGPTVLTEGATIILSLAATAQETITITNDDKFTDITWYCGGSTARTVGSGDNFFNITAGTAPFTALVVYPVTVVGKTATGAHSTSFKVQIVN